MRYKLISIAALAATMIGVSTASAQVTTGARGPAAAQERRAEMREKLKTMTPDERKVAIAAAKEKREARNANLTDAQKAWQKSLNGELKTTHDGVKAGTLTKETAAQQLKAWRDANPRPKTAGTEN